MPTSSVPRELLIADACRAAADWLLTPTGDKIPGTLAVDADGQHRFGHDPGAIKWCALGRVQYELRDQPALTGPPRGNTWIVALQTTIFDMMGKEDAQQIAETFNRGDHHTAAILLRAAATRLEQHAYSEQRAAYELARWEAEPPPTRAGYPITIRPGDTLDETDDEELDEEPETDEAPARDAVPA